MFKFIQMYETFMSKKPIRKMLSNYKYKHSKRVAKLTKQLSSSSSVYNAALYHDVLERVEDEDDNHTQKTLDFYTYQLVLCLTHKEDEDTLEALKSHLNGKTQQLIDDVVIIKLCDRADNLLTKYKRGKLKKKYIKKSAKLIKFLFESFSKDTSILYNFLELNVYPTIPKLKEKLSESDSLYTMPV